MQTFRELTLCVQRVAERRLHDAAVRTSTRFLASTRRKGEPAAVLEYKSDANGVVFVYICVCVCVVIDRT